MGDGHLQHPPKNRLDYTSKSIKELNRFGKEIYDVFKINGKIRKCSTNKYKTYNYGVNNKTLALFLHSIGVPAGAKVFQDFRVPKWILQDRRFFARFINRLFSCECGVDVSSKCIEIRMHKSLNLLKEGIGFFNDIRFYLGKYYDIRTTKPFLAGDLSLRRDGHHTKGIRMKIKNKESLINFQKFISIEDKEKQKKLNQII